ncbi:MAG: hypothetical protein HYS13_18020 [Planctomycetia bacterium]|nr:hypothetical protein [Planctomycetia bacterium]
MTREQKTVPIQHHYPQELQSSFANHFVVQHSPAGEFHVSFFEIVPPLLLSQPEAPRKASGEVNHVDANCVARLVLARKRVEELIIVLSESLQRFQYPTGASNGAGASQGDEG